MSSDTTEQGVDIPGLTLEVDPYTLPGTFQADGTIVFTDLDFQPTVTTNQLLGKFNPEEQNGPEVVGGENVTIDIEDDGIAFYASTNGICRLINNQLSVFEILEIQEDVGFETGNLQFDGSIYVRGKLGQAFHIKAGGDVIICGDVESGAKISAMGIVSIGGSVHGIRTKIIAMEGIQAGRIHDAYAFSGKDIRLGSHAENATLRSGGSILIRNTDDPRSGCISGGQSWALNGMDLYVVGSPTGTQTKLNAGLDLEHGKKLDDLTGKIETGNQQIQRLLDRFGMNKLDVDQIKKRLAAAQGPKRKILANSAHQLGTIVKAHQDLLKERAKLHDTLGKRYATAQVIVREKAYSGVAIRIGDLATRLQNEIENSIFTVRNDTVIYSPISQRGEVPDTDE